MRLGGSDATESKPPPSAIWVESIRDGSGLNRKLPDANGRNAVSIWRLCPKPSMAEAISPRVGPVVGNLLGPTDRLVVNTSL